MFAYFDVLVCFLFENDKLFPRNKITYHDNEQQLTPETASTCMRNKCKF